MTIKQAIFQNPMRAFLFFALGLIELANYTYFIGANLFGEIRNGWGNVNYLFSLLIGSVLLILIVHWGFQKQNFLSWFSAVIAGLVSFVIYSEIKSEWNVISESFWTDFSKANAIVIVLSLLPLAFAKITKEIGANIETKTRRIHVIDLDAIDEARLMRHELDLKVMNGVGEKEDAVIKNA